MRDDEAGMSLITAEIKRIDLRYILAAESTDLDLQIMCTFSCK